LPNLFSCQISSSPVFTGCPPRRVWIVPTSGCATPQSSNPMFGAKRLPLTVIRITVVAFDAQHWIEFSLYARFPCMWPKCLERSVKKYNVYRNADQSPRPRNLLRCREIYQPRYRTDPHDSREYQIPNCTRSLHSVHKILVELTGIEPVASWLQTRRSPS
jgi:hypothetical protein